MLTQKRLMELLYCDQDTGIFTWKVQVGPRGKKGSVAGGLGSRGYRSIQIDNKHYSEHRLVWLYFKGSFPSGELDHINRIPTDNRIENLREVTRSENNQNIHVAHANSRSGIRGVSWSEGKSSWRARIRINGKCIYIGRYLTKEEAEDAYLEHKRKFHPIAFTEAKL